jgi:hypothetical protein
MIFTENHKGLYLFQTSIPLNKDREAGIYTCFGGALGFCHAIMVEFTPRLGF